MGRWRADPPSFKLRKFYFLVAAVAITCLVVATMEVTEFFKPNLNVQHHNRLNLMEESPAEYNFDGSPSRKSQPVSDFSHSLPPASPSGSDSSPLNTLLDSSNELLFPNPKSNLERKANEAWSVGGEVSKELMQIDVFPVNLSVWNPRFGTKAESCPESIVISGLQLKDSNNYVHLPCGIEVGSMITLVAKPLQGYLSGNEELLVSQFAIELLGPVEDEDLEPPRILHFNPRLKGDFSRKPVIEQNTCYRGQWGIAQRCGENPSSALETKVDGQVTCEGWLIDDKHDDKDFKSLRWLGRLHKNTKQVYSSRKGEFPFMENRVFVLTITAGLEGYHSSVDGKPITSFHYRPGFSLSDVESVFVHGDLHVETIVATSLPIAHQGMLYEELVRGTEDCKAPPLPKHPIHIFVGIISASNHFAERMAIRRTWLRSQTIQSSQVVARFFAAFHRDKTVNLQVKKEAEYYGDMIILPFIDHYELLVLKTLAIVEFGMQNMSAEYIMKCDDDTFVNMDAVMEQLKEFRDEQSLFMGFFNWVEGPQRHGKWAVAYEEWPEEVYPPYANGPGYIISKDIAEFIVSGYRNNRLEIFKMEDVSMGMWVLKFNETLTKSGNGLRVRYEDNWRFSQAGCVENYLSAHYQSPRHMLCMWEKLNSGHAQCCTL